MWIKSIVLDGFKSYAQRTEINGFDQYFNAITGLNGSGKSNILDGICFLLGITNLAHVRAVNLNELVYKNGQGAVTKATVSITFDNTDPSQCPPGFEDFDEITITRQIAIGNRNKYLINGIAASNMRVQDLFRSIQLNVNNPHFLIMQGRITKVLNMKPLEILSMIEEATGTMMYENKKESSQKSMEKKDARIKDIDDLLNEDIIPRLTKHKEERAAYLEYQKIVRELEHLNKFYMAFRYYCCEEARKKHSVELQGLEERVAKAQSKIAQGEKRVKDLKKEIKEIHDKRGKEVEAALKALQGKLEEALNNETIVTSSMNNMNNALETEQQKLQQMERQLVEENNTLPVKKKELQKLEEELKKMRERNEKDKQAHSEAVRHLQAARVGMATSIEGTDASVDGQLRAAKIAISTAETKFKETQIRLKHCEEELRTKSSTLKRNEASYKVDQEKLNQLKESIEKLESELEQLNYEENSEEKLQEDVRRLESKCSRLREHLHNLEARSHQLQFEYQDPEPNFDRRSVKGLVAKLINVKDANNATALEVVAAGKLYQLVVDTEVTGKKILDRGMLRNRITIIPLNKISGQPIPEHVVRKAQSLVGTENVCTALSLVGFDRELETAMAYVFGTSFVCVNMDVARKVTFNDSIKKKSVTISGDSFDPAGIASGGARAQSDSILLRVKEIKAINEEYNVTLQQLQKLSAQHRTVQQVAQRWRKMMEELDLKRSEYQMLCDKLRNSAHGQQLAEIEELTTFIAELREQLQESSATKEKYSRRAEELEEMMQNKDAVMEKEVKRAEVNLQNAKMELEASNLKLKNKEQEHHNLKLEFGEYEKELEELGVQIVKQKEEMEERKAEIGIQGEEWTAAKAKVASCQEAVNKQKEVSKNCNLDIEKIYREQQDIDNQKNSFLLEIEEFRFKIDQTKQDSKENMDQFEALMSANPWIDEEKKHFNQPNTAYDFKARNPTEVLKKIQKLKSMKDKLSKNVNMRVMSMLSESEAQYNDVNEKKKSLLKDRNRIREMMDTIDEKKNLAVNEAFTQINRDFGSIFSTLLPGASAKLIPADGSTIQSGVEFKIGFGGIWKESLSELSGGQRSLVALSLILAMLLYNPAPLYILDEVDAALDISHTQNIGIMLRTHFKHSQFVVVSLKDGMFNNANVLFKTRFVDGVSAVTRYAQKQNAAVEQSRPEQSRKRKKII